MRKYIKLFEEFKTEKEIDEICDQYGIRNYTINDDGSIDVDGNVDLYDLGIYRLPLRFRKVSGAFECNDNILTTLEGCPIECDSFIADSCQLTSLEHSPKYVRNFFSIENNVELYSFEHFPEFVGGVLALPDNLALLYSTFHKYDLIEAFGEYNIIKAPKNSDDKPKLKVSNLNKFLVEFDFNPIDSKMEEYLSKYYNLL